MLSRIIADEDIRGILIIATFTLGWIIYQRSTLLVEFFRYLRFICNHDGHYTSAAVALKGKVIAWAVPGRPITYYLSDVASMKKMMGTLPTMDTKHLADLLHFHGWQIPMGQHGIHETDKQVHQALAKSKLGPLIERFNPYIMHNIEKTTAMVGEQQGRFMPLQCWGYRMIYRSVTPTVFGDDFPTEETRIWNQHFAENVHWVNITMMLPVLPYWVWERITPGGRRAVYARDRVKEYLEAWELAGGVKTASDTYKSIAEVLDKGNYSSDVKAKWLNTVQFGFLANTGESVGWFLLYVTQSPKLLAKIREELDPIPMESIPSVDIKRLAPHLDSAIQETFRLIGAVFAGRRVIKTTTLPGLEHPLPKGSIVRTMTRTLVFDKSIWGEDAHFFRGDRFTGERGSKLYREMMTFGSGVSQCPGRFFAIHELQIVFATLLKLYDFGPVTFAEKQPFDSEDGLVGAPRQGQTARIIDLEGQTVEIAFPGYERNKGIEAISGLLQPAVEPISKMSLRKPPQSA